MKPMQMIKHDELIFFMANQRGNGVKRWTCDDRMKLNLILLTVKFIYNNYFYKSKWNVGDRVKQYAT